MAMEEDEEVPLVVAEKFESTVLAVSSLTRKPAKSSFRRLAPSA